MTRKVASAAAQNWVCFVVDVVVVVVVAAAAASAASIARSV